MYGLDQSTASAPSTEKRTPAPCSSPGAQTRDAVRSRSRGERVNAPNASTITMPTPVHSRVKASCSMFQSDHSARTGADSWRRVSMPSRGRSIDDMACGLAKDVVGHTAERIGKGHGRGLARIVPKPLIATHRGASALSEPRRSGPMPALPAFSASKKLCQNAGPSAAICRPKSTMLR